MSHDIPKHLHLESILMYATDAAHHVENLAAQGDLDDERIVVRCLMDDLSRIKLLATNALSIMEHVVVLEEAARNVVNSWESGDLAGAVTELGYLVDVNTD